MRPLANQRGSSLVLVLLALGLLGTLGVAASVALRDSRLQSDIALEQSRLRHVARAGLEWAIAELLPETDQWSDLDGDDSRYAVALDADSEFDVHFAPQGGGNGNDGNGNGNGNNGQGEENGNGKKKGLKGDDDDEDDGGNGNGNGNGNQPVDLLVTVVARVGDAERTLRFTLSPTGNSGKFRVDSVEDPALMQWAGTWKDTP